LSAFGGAYHIFHGRGETGLFWWCHYQNWWTKNSSSPVFRP
jgi:hypothetical protein